LNPLQVDPNSIPTFKPLALKRANRFTPNARTTEILERARVDARFILIEISAALESAIRCIPQSGLVQSSFIKRGL
jgi:hypothetical protein